jgi:hypothetical protein
MEWIVDSSDDGEFFFILLHASHLVDVERFGIHEFISAGTMYLLYTNPRKKFGWLYRIYSSPGVLTRTPFARSRPTRRWKKLATGTSKRYRTPEATEPYIHRNFTRTWIQNKGRSTIYCRSLKFIDVNKKTQH